MNRAGTRWRGKLPIPQHTHPTVRRLFELANDEQTTISEIANRSGHRRETISDWRYRRTPSVADLDAALNVLGYKLSVARKRDC